MGAKRRAVVIIPDDTTADEIVQLLAATTTRYPDAKLESDGVRLIITSVQKPAPALPAIEPLATP